MNMAAGQGSEDTLVPKRPCNAESRAAKKRGSSTGDYGEAAAVLSETSLTRFQHARSSVSASVSEPHQRDGVERCLRQRSTSGLEPDEGASQTALASQNKRQRIANELGAGGTYIPIFSAAARAGLYVGDSNIDNAGRGLFSTEPLLPGSLIGWYTGQWSPEAQFEALTAAQQELLARYAVTVVPELDNSRRRRGQKCTPMVVSPPMADGSTRPDPALHPMAFANEVSEHLTANAAFTTVQVNADDISETVPAECVDGEWLGLAVYAGTHIAANSEIFIHYGGRYSRELYNYKDGNPCTLPSELEAVDALGTVPFYALSLVLGSSSDVSDDDSSYDGNQTKRRPRNPRGGMPRRPRIPRGGTTPKSRCAT